MLLSVSIMPCTIDVGVLTVADLKGGSKDSMEPPFQGEACTKNFFYFIWGSHADSKRKADR